MSTPPPPAPWIGALLRLAWQDVRSQIGESVRSAGFPDVTQAHISLFRYPGLDRCRPTQLAEELQISKQAVNDLLRELERRGYLTREVDAEDRRSRLIRLTARGTELEHTIQAAAQRADADLERRLGRRRFDVLRSALIEAVGINGRATTHRSLPE